MRGWLGGCQRDREEGWGCRRTVIETSDARGVFAPCAGVATAGLARGSVEGALHLSRVTWGRGAGKSGGVREVAKEGDGQARHASRVLRFLGEGEVDRSTDLRLGGILRPERTKRKVVSQMRPSSGCSACRWPGPERDLTHPSQGVLFSRVVGCGGRPGEVGPGMQENKL